MQAKDVPGRWRSCHDLHSQLQFMAAVRRLPDVDWARVYVFHMDEYLAFNDPPADFGTSEIIHVVDLDDDCRRQQLGEGHFPTLAEVPRQAITLTIPALLAPGRVLAVVPERRKAAAVLKALEGPVTPDCPASILQLQPHARLYLDGESSALLT